MAKHKKFYQQDYLGHIGATVFLITSFLGLVFMTVGTPLGVLMSREEPRSCHTLWGLRPNCWNAAYSWRVDQEQCHDRRQRWETAQAFSIIAIFNLLINCGFAWYQIGDNNIKMLTFALGFTAIATTTVPWAIVTSFYYTHFCGEYTFTQRERTFGAGYILMVTSFAIQGVGLIVFLFAEPQHVDKRAKKAAADKKQREKDKKRKEEEEAAMKSPTASAHSGSENGHEEDEDEDDQDENDRLHDGSEEASERSEDEL